MTIKQISVFLENKAGTLAELTDFLHRHDIDMRALSIAEAQDFGIVRMIVDDVYATTNVLKEAGYVFSITPVLVVKMADEPGGLYKILKVLGDGGVNLEYLYAFLANQEAYTILRVADKDKAIDVLKRNGVTLVCQDEIAAL